MKSFTRIIIPGLLLVLGMTASATTLTVNSYILEAGEANGGGTGGEFGASLNGSQTVLDVYCIDFSDEFSWGAVYNNTSPNDLTLSTGANVSNTLLGTNTTWYNNFGGSYNGQDRYLMAAWLTTQYAPPSSAANDSIQLAIWELLDISTNLTNYNAASVTDVNDAIAWLNNLLLPANSAALTAFENRVTIYTDTAQSMQEFLSVASPVPEPSSVALMSIGCALIGLGAMRLRRKNVGR